MEFTEALSAIERNRWLSASLGRNGRQFYREQYDWPVIERKYLDMFERLSKESTPRSVDPLPGWMERRRQDCPAGSTIVASLPSGPVLQPGTSPDRQQPPQAAQPAAPQYGADRGRPSWDYQRRPASRRGDTPPRTGGV
jgi:hypothetical protein